MIYLIMPFSSSHGWGVCGKYLAREISKREALKCITEQFSADKIGDELEELFLRTKIVQGEELAGLANGSITSVPFPVLQATEAHYLSPWLLKLKGSFSCGYTFFEVDNLLPKYVDNARNNFDWMVAGSTWCENVLRAHGLENVSTVLQGVDPQLFNPTYSAKEFFEDYFVIFSGGQFSLRKGQDLVIRAYKVMQDRHPDVLLVNAWASFWPQAMKTMQASPYIQFQITSENHLENMQRMYVSNGLDPSRIITIPIRPNALMAKIYKNTDIGLFPNRCEGGTNLVMMEYMACGKPVVASYSSGHKDILTDSNALPVKKLAPFSIDLVEEGIRHTWDDPDLDEIVVQLEWAYQNRGGLRKIGEQAGHDLANYTWKQTAAGFCQVIQQQSGG